jgi:hypothetical protein
MKLIKADNLKEAINSFRPRPLMESELEEFYVYTEEARCANVGYFSKLRDVLDKGDFTKVLFAGHTGSGKSTEINKLEQDIQDRFFIVKFSVRDQLDLYNFEYIDLLLVLIEQVLDAAKNRNVKISETTLETVYEWFSQRVVTKITDLGYGMDLSAGIKTEESVLSKLCGLFLTFKNNIKLSSDTRDEIRRTIKPNINLFKTQCNSILRDISNKIHPEGKNILIIIEDLDKLDMQFLKETFFEHSGILSEINVKTIFTVPIFLLMYSEFRKVQEKFKYITLPMIKINNQDGSTEEENRSKIEDIVNRRIQKGLVSEEALKLAIEKTGGVLRDLFEALENAANSAYYRSLKKKTQDTETINMDDISYGLNQVKTLYNRIITGDKAMGFTTADLYNYMKEIYSGKKKILENDELLIPLLDIQAIIEYNGEQWFAIHPLVVDLMTDLRYLGAKNE